MRQMFDSNNGILRKDYVDGFRNTSSFQPKSVLVTCQDALTPRDHPADLYYVRVSVPGPLFLCESL